jgi:hypothetical protein
VDLLFKIPLAQALQIRKDLDVEIGTLCNKRALSATYISYEDGDTAFADSQRPEINAEDYTKLIQEKRLQLALLQAVIDKANVETMTGWVEGGHALTINGLWAFQQGLKAELAYAGRYGRCEQKKVSKGSRRTVTGENGRIEIIRDPDNITEAPFNVKYFQELEKTIERKVRAIDTELQRVNWGTMVDIEATGIKIDS